VTQTHELTLISKPGCHLCEDAEGVITKVLAEFALEQPRIRFDLIQKNIADDPALHARYAEEIPVLLIDGKVHNYWRIDPERFISALRALDKRS
jgi:glutaredoxin